MAQRVGTMDKDPYGPCTYTRHWFNLDLSRLLLVLTGIYKGER